MNIDYRNKVKNYLLNNKKVTREKLRLWLMGIIPSGIAYRKYMSVRKAGYKYFCKKHRKKYDPNINKFNCVDSVLSGKKHISYQLISNFLKRGLLIEKEGFIYLNDKNILRNKEI